MGSSNSRQYQPTRTEILSFLEPHFNGDTVIIESYTQADRRCVEFIQRDIEKRNTTIQMNDLNVESLFQNALNQKTSEIFKYQWKYNQGQNKGELLLFFLKIKILNEQIEDKTIKMEIDIAFGPRYFNVTNRELPVEGSQAFLQDSMYAIKQAAEHKQSIVLFPAKLQYQ